MLDNVVTELSAVLTALAAEPNVVKSNLNPHYFFPIHFGGFHVGTCQAPTRNEYSPIITIVIRLLCIDCHIVATCQERLSTIITTAISGYYSNFCSHYYSDCDIVGAR